MKQLVLSGAALMLLVQCNSPKEDKNEEMTENPVAFELSNIDSTVSPCDNFYKYAIGSWQKDNPVPATEGRWMSFNILAENNREKIQGILDESLKAENPAKGSNLQLIQDFYKSALDTNGRNEQGFTALTPFLDKVAAIESREGLNDAFATLRKTRVGTPVSFYVGRDAENSEEYIVYASQAGLTLGDKSYYLNEEEKFQEIRAKYVEHVDGIFALAGRGEALAGKTVLEVETKLAQISWDRKDLRDADRTYNKMTVASFDSMLNNLQVANMLKLLGLGAADEMVVRTVSFYTDLDSLMNEISLEEWRTYLTWHVFSGYGSHINDEFEQKTFDFFSTTMRGVKEMRPRKERILRVVDGSLGEPLGKLFVEKYFPEESKQYMSELIENLRGAYKQSILNLTWMGDSTKDKALKKLEAFTYKIGYPDKWKDYSGLDISADNYLQNIVNISKHGFEMMVDKLGKPVDKDEWHMSPQMVNAYYSPSGNEIVFPAGILQPPFFHPSFDDAINYGGIGGVIGHEFTHGFDDQGAKYDWNGNKVNWWTDEDRARFKALTQALAEQYSKYEVLPGEFVNGELTLGENIADLGGTTLSYAALEKVMEGKEDPMVDGFTWQQRFFLGWANVWKGNITDETLRNRILTDPHSPAEQRVLGPLANLPQFEEAFGCAGKAMVKPDSTQIKIW
ncbi:MAG: M13 family metallopeptidase [Bacteroidia bacterium]|nr:M13 family metallopeptidase [Bacteroidia bacterium]